MQNNPKPLRILMVINLPWDSRLGATRVMMELAEQWRASGNVVEKYSLSDAYPNVTASSARFTLRQVFFSYRAAAFIRKNSAKFDVVDALIGVLPFSKKKLGFHGLLVARSVGLYRLYEQFDRSVEKRWPGRSKGKFLGRIFYALTRRQLLRASDMAVRHADLINLPNEEEAACLRQELGPHLPILVQPYGLTAERRGALRQAAAAPRSGWRKREFVSSACGARERARAIGPASFDGFARAFPKRNFVFSARWSIPSRSCPTSNLTRSKASNSFPTINPTTCRDCWRIAPSAPFRVTRRDSASRCSEQLAAGIPTVAYDTAGPRDLLAPRLPELLVPKGDVGAFATAIGDILQLRSEDYEKLAARSGETATKFSWPAIADATLDAYRHSLKGGGKVFFVQPFSLGSAGGGARILRALLERAPFAWQSICTSPGRPKAWPNEMHLHSRPAWGRIEHSRFAPIPNVTAPFFAPIFRKRLKELCAQHGARAIHAVPHAGLDFAQVHAVARELALPFFISVHDDLAYTAASAGPPEEREAAMRAAWREASARFVISEALGREYCERYGARDYQVVTDGLSDLTPPRADGRFWRIANLLHGIVSHGV